jgi:hypothetical protein
MANTGTTAVASFGLLPMIVDWLTPNFYFFHDRKLLKIVTGWPRLGNAEALAQGLDAIGIRKERLNDDAGKLTTVP